MLYSFRKSRYTADEYATAILQLDITMLSKAITLIESNRSDDNTLAEDVIEKISQHTGNAIRIGITGLPGAGKSSFIEALGSYITSKDKRVAVLSIDPSSAETNGSILGDKTRMNTLGLNDKAYVRPSAAGRTLGGTHSKTREAMLLCEAAGFDVIIIETVGVGQNETTVRNMVDCLLLMLIAGAGDELQGIKRGIVEAADVIIINKADGENKRHAQLAKQEYQNALQLLVHQKNDWHPQVCTCSALNNEGVAETWEMIGQFEKQLKQNGYWEQQRREQNIRWMHELIFNELLHQFYRHAALKHQKSKLERAVRNGSVTAMHAARQLLTLFKNADV